MNPHAFTNKCGFSRCFDGVGLRFGNSSGIPLLSGTPLLVYPAEEVAMKVRTIAITIAACALFTNTMSASADSLSDKAKSGQPIRIGFASEIPWAYPGTNNQPEGFANAVALGTLKSMGYTNIEPVVTDWGGLIPGLQAGRFDIITGGMYITGNRCKNVSFAEPMGKFGDAFLVAAGNPKGIQTYKDIKDTNARMVTVAGFVNADAAIKESVSESQITQVPSPTEVLAAVRTGRADAGAGNLFAMKSLAATAPDKLEVTDPAKLPEWTFNWVGIAFKNTDPDFLKAYNEAQKKYLGTPEMLAAAGKYEYTAAQLPGDTKTDWICSNR